LKRSAGAGRPFLSALWVSFLTDWIGESGGSYHRLSISRRGRRIEVAHETNMDTVRVHRHTRVRAGRSADAFGATRGLHGLHLCFDLDLAWVLEWTV
jgi:hypothetical protein